MIQLGKTGIMVTKTAVGCLPVQRRTVEEGVKILRAAYEGGINYFDTANAYTDSEEKLGKALSDVRHNVVISTKSQAGDKKTAAGHIEQSLRVMKTDYIDLFQFHHVKSVPEPNDPEGAFAAALEAREKGYIRAIGVTTHGLEVAEKCIASGLFETLQYPMSYLSIPRELALADKCRQAGMTFIAMKGLAGGLLGKNPRACYAFMKRYPEVVNIWGVQTMEELSDWLALDREDPDLDDGLWAVIENDRQELSGSFCRSCGYCSPCTVGIEIFNCARMDMLLRRSPWQQYYTPQWRARMEKISACIECGACKPRCPYGLDIPNVLKHQLRDYNEFYAARMAEKE